MHIKGSVFGEGFHLQAVSIAKSTASFLSYVSVSAGSVRIPGDIVTHGGTHVVQEGLHCHHYVEVVVEDEGVCQLPDIGLKPRTLVDRILRPLVFILPYWTCGRGVCEG